MASRTPFRELYNKYTHQDASQDSLTLRRFRNVSSPSRRPVIPQHHQAHHVAISPHRSCGNAIQLPVRAGELLYQFLVPPTLTKMGQALIEVKYTHQGANDYGYTYVDLCTPDVVPAIIILMPSFPGEIAGCKFLPITTETRQLANGNWIPETLNRNMQLGLRPLLPDIDRAVSGLVPSSTYVMREIPKDRLPWSTQSAVGITSAVVNSRELENGALWVGMVDRPTLPALPTRELAPQVTVNERWC